MKMMKIAVNRIDCEVIFNITESSQWTLVKWQNGKYRKHLNRIIKFEKIAISNFHFPMLSLISRSDAFERSRIYFTSISLPPLPITFFRSKFNSICLDSRQFTLKQCGRPFFRCVYPDGFTILLLDSIRLD